MLRCEKNLMDTPRAVVLIVHGLAEHLGRYDCVTERLNDFGYSVYRYDQRGHGRSDGEKGFFPRYDTLADDVNAMVEFARKENEGLPLFLLGHSMGGMSVVGFSIKHPNKVKGVILSGALCVDLNPAPDDLPADSHAMIPLPDRFSRFICSDPEVVKAYQDDPAVLKEITAGIFLQTKACLKWFNTDKNLTRISYPILILHGGEDKLVLPQNARHLYDNVSSSDKEIKVYKGLYHEILNEKAKDRIIEGIHVWMAKRLT
jgi:lysophospholipase